MKIVILILLVINTFPDVYPIKNIKLNVGQNLDYKIDYLMDVNMNFDTISYKMPSSMVLLLPLEVISKTDTNYKIKIDFNEIDGQMKSIDPQNAEKLSIDFKELLENSASSNTAEQVFDNINDFVYSVNYRGIFTELNNTSLDPTFSKIFNNFSMYSGGYFVIIPKDTKSPKWTEKFESTTDVNGMALGFSMINQYEFVGLQELNGAEYLRVNYIIKDVNLDMDNPMIKMMDMSMESDISGYYLVQKDTGVTQYQFTNGKMTIKMDMNKMSNSFVSDEDKKEYDSKKVINMIMNIQSTMILK